MTPINHILVIDPDPVLRGELADRLTGQGHRVSEASEGEQGLRLLAEHGFQLVISELDMPGSGGLDVVSYVREHTPHTPIVLLSQTGSLPGAVEAMRRGAFDFHTKPVIMEQFLFTIQRALEKASLHKAFDSLRREQPYIYSLENILAASSPMQRVLEQVSRVAASDVTVLLTGETGTGKSLIAGAIHANSPRCDHTLVTVNCAALTETLLESELFGHEKGAFTGAHKYRTGRFEQAHGGSLFLDEVGDMSPATQAKVLRAIEDKVVQRVGGSRSIHVDVRILAATNVDLERAVREGRFREDLFYRLNVTPINVPPLRERTEDIVPLAELFLRRLAGEARPAPFPFSAVSRQAMLAHPWPGNIRELRNMVERAMLFANGPEITPADLGLGQAAPSRSQEPPARPKLDTLDLKTLERLAIETALERSNWVQSRAATLLGITPRALVYKLDKLNLTQPELMARRRRH